MSALHQHNLRTNEKDSPTQYPLEGTGRIAAKKGTVDTTSSGSEVDSLQDHTFESESPDQLQTFFNPETGATFTLTPRTSIYSDGRDAESEEMYPSDEPVLQKLVLVSQGHQDASQTTYVLKR